MKQTNNMGQTDVIVKCKELDDQYECDAKRFPIKVLVDVEPNKLKRFRHYGYEIYVADKNGNLELIQDYEDYD